MKVVLVQDVSTEALSALTKFLVADASIGDTLDRVVVLSNEAVKGAVFAGLAMLDDQERATTAAFTDKQAPRIDQAQYETGRGPCLDAWRTKTIIRLDDLERVDDDDDDDYVEFAAACLAHGIHSTLSLPLVAGGNGVGALNFYSSDKHGFDEEDERAAEDFATAAAAVVVNAVAYWGAYDLSQQLTEALESRAVIEQAKGMLMARGPAVDSDTAFQMLRKASQRENVKLRTIAQRIVDRTQP